MKNEINQIDNFYRETLGVNSSEVSAYTWTRMRWRLFWINYSGYILGVGAATIVVLAIIFGPAIFEKNEIDAVATNQPIDNSKTDAINTNETLVIKEANENKNTSGIIIHSEKELKETNEEVFEVPVKSNVQLEESQPVKEQIVSVQMSGDFFTEEKSDQELNQFSTIESLNVDEEISDNLELAEYTAQFEDTKVHFDIERKKHWVSLGLYVAPGYTTSSLKAADGYEEYLQYREEHESPAVSISAGLDVRINMRKWYIQTGLAYTDFRQQRNYNNSFKALDSLGSYYQTDTIWGWAYDPPNLGEAIVLGYDTTFIPVYNQTNQGINRWSYIEIPLVAGYKFKTGRFALDIGTGFSCAYLLNVDGNVPHLSEENKFTNLKDIEDEMNKYLFSYILQLGASYYITPEWSIHFSPFYKQNLNSVFNNNYPVNQKFRSIGINFGLKVDL